MIQLNRVTCVMIFLIAIGLVAFGTKPTAVTTLMFRWAPSVINTLKLPTPNPFSVVPLYAAGTFSRL